MKETTMSNQKSDGLSRREFLGTATAAGTGLLLGFGSEAIAAESPLETTKIRLLRIPSICQAPQFVAEEFFKAEGFRDIEYIPKPGAKGIETALASGEADINMHFNARLLMRVEAGDPIVILAGEHVGCFELFATERVRSVRDLKGKTVGVLELESAQHAFIASMVAHVGLDPKKDIHWLPQPPAESMRQLADGKIDAFLGFPPEPQQLRSTKNRSIHVLVNSMVDRPWSHYFCCMVAGNREFVRKHPVTTKRALRAILNASSLIAREPERTARFLVDRGFTKNYNFALEALREMGMAFIAWRDFDPEDTLRFYALRLHEAGMIKSSPQKIIAQGTDWRFLKELKKELKG
jgi:NitT/TauT family transport system substrate-binding protein